MPKTTEERYLEWLDREEENLGADYMERATLDVDTFRQMLKDELTPEAMGGAIDKLIDAADTKYRDYAAISVSFERLERAWGTQPAYRDLITGKYVSGSDVAAAVAAYKKGRK